jgi:hypothetical protein
MLTVFRIIIIIRRATIFLGAAMAIGAVLVGLVHAAETSPAESARVSVAQIFEAIVAYARSGDSASSFDGDRAIPLRVEAGALSGHAGAMPGSGKEMSPDGRIWNRSVILEGRVKPN